MTHHLSQQAHGAESPGPEACTTAAQESTLPPAHSCSILPFHREFLAHFTGKWPDGGYRPRWRRPPAWHLIKMLLSLLGGVTASTILLSSSPAWWPLLALSWMITVYAGRSTQLVHCHYAVHGTLMGHPRYDRAVAEILSTLWLIQPFDGYRRDHVTRHHGRHFATLADPDVQLLLHLGFRPGMSRQDLWCHLYLTLVSPRFHALMGWMRLRANFLTAPVYRRLMAGGCAAAVVAGLLLTQGWLPFMVAWVVPILPLYHIAALLQFVTEHRWLQVPQPPTPATGQETLERPPAHTTKLLLGRLTFGRFVGDPLPSHTLPPRPWLYAWGRWGIRLLLLHIPTRLCVLVGDLCQHDWHHRHPHGDWSNACYERHCDLAAGCPGWPEPYTEVWGLDKAIDEVFQGLADLPPLPAPRLVWRDLAEGAVSM